MNQEAARLIVCERTGRWAVALRGKLPDSGVRVLETRSLAECWRSLAESPSGFLVVELTPSSADDLVRRFSRLGREYPRVRAAVVAQRNLADHEWLVREAGAVHFTCSPRQIALLAEVACRHLGRVEVTEPRVTEWIWASLPWQGR